MNLQTKLHQLTEKAVIEKEKSKAKHTTHFLDALPKALSQVAMHGDNCYDVDTDANDICITMLVEWCSLNHLDCCKVTTAPWIYRIKW